MTPGMRSFDLFNHEYDYKPNWTARSSVILPISHNYNNICDILCFLKTKTHDILTVFLLEVKVKTHSSVRVWWRIMSSYSVLLVLKSGQLIANQIWEFCYSYDLEDYKSALNFSPLILDPAFLKVWTIDFVQSLDQNLWSALDEKLVTLSTFC